MTTDKTIWICDMCRTFFETEPKYHGFIEASGLVCETPKFADRRCSGHVVAYTPASELEKLQTKLDIAMGGLEDIIEGDDTSPEGTKTKRFAQLILDEIKALK